MEASVIEEEECEKDVCTEREGKREEKNSSLIPCY